MLVLKILFVYLIASVVGTAWWILWRAQPLRSLGIFLLTVAVGGTLGVGFNLLLAAVVE
jgi:hypothetical protein